MYPYLGDFNTGATIFVPFQTFDSNGASVTLTGLAVTDIEIYKGASMTQRASDAGYALVDTDGIDLDSITGLHGFTIDTSDNTDAGFYAAGNDYTVVVSAVTVDTQTVNFIAARFSIMNRAANVTHFGGTAGTFASGRPEVNMTHIAGSAVNASSAQLGVNVVNFGGSAGSFASGVPSVALTTSSKEAVADQVWDEATSGHVTAGSFGQAWGAIRAGTAQAGAGTTITLDTGANGADDFYNNQRIFITGGTGAGQGRIIEDYTGATKVATVATWGTNPDASSVFVILPFGAIPGATAPTASEVADAVWDEARADHVAAGSFGQASPVLRSGTAQAGAASTITLDSGAYPTNDIYNYDIVTIISGTGAGQSRQIIDYVGASKVATVGVSWTTNPDATSVFVITPLGVDAATLTAIADAVWDEARSGHTTAGTFGEYVLADAVRISGDATAADNAESFFDGTGYAGTNNTIPTVTSVTNIVTANATQISGDSAAADNLEAAADGTGYNLGGGLVVAASVTGAVGSVTATVSANVIQISGDATAADNLESYCDGTTPMPVNTTRINNVVVTGAGTALSPWGP